MVETFFDEGIGQLKKELPRVSVVMSVYNGEKYLREAVDSILDQTFNDFEFIIINDGSTDKTQEILDTYNDQRIVLVTQDNMGLTKSLNKGISVARGCYIARQDADDVSMPRRLEEQIGFLEKNGTAALIGSEAEIIDEAAVKLGLMEYPSDNGTIKKEIRRYNCFCHGSVIFKKDSFLAIGGYREFFQTAQDYDLWLRFVERYEASNLKATLYRYRFNSESLTFSKVLLQRRMADIAKKLADVRELGAAEENALEEFGKSLGKPATESEKTEIIRSYSPWGLLLLRNGKKSEAFRLMSDVFEYHPSSFSKKLFGFAKRIRSAYILERLINE